MSAADVCNDCKRTIHLGTCLTAAFTRIAELEKELHGREHPLLRETGTPWEFENESDANPMPDLQSPEANVGGNATPLSAYPCESGQEIMDLDSQGRREVSPGTSESDHNHPAKVSPEEAVIERITKSLCDKLPYCAPQLVEARVRVSITQAYMRGAEAEEVLFEEWAEQYDWAVNKLRETVKTVRAWDMLNPGNPERDLCDGKFFRTLLDEALHLTTFQKGQTGKLNVEAIRKIAESCPEWVCPACAWPQERSPELRVKYEGFGWILVPKFVDDPSKPWEERFAALEAHHERETTFLIAEVRKLVG
jgi:hypothetical protein